MTPCNMKCNTCGDYIAKAKKFNARKETVEGEDYMGLRIYRFYFKCPICMAEITFKTDPKNQDYELEHGATRNFQAYRLAEMQAAKEAQEAEEEEKLNPMKMLENRTKASKREMQALEDLEELKELSSRTVVLNTEELLEREKERKKRFDEMIRKQQEEEDEAKMQALLEEQNRLLLTNQPVTGTRVKKWIKLEGSDEQVEVSDDEGVTEDPVSTGEVKEESEVPDVKPVSEKSSDPPVIITHRVFKDTDLSVEKGTKRKVKQLANVVVKKKVEPAASPNSSATHSTPSSTPSGSAALSSLCSYSDSDSDHE